MIPGLAHAYRQAHSRLLLFDYDGVLALIVDRPELATPSKKLLDALAMLSKQPETKIVVVSGRDRDTLERWLGNVPIDMSAEHGHFIKEQGVWSPVTESDISWKEEVLAAMGELVEKYPGSHIETKSASVVWHYREVEGVDEALAYERIKRAAQMRAEIMRGKCVVDVRALGADKGQAVRHWYDQKEWDFVLCAGDDVTDEAMFEALPETAWTIKIGDGPTAARFDVHGQAQILEMLEHLTLY